MSKHHLPVAPEGSYPFSHGFTIPHFCILPTGNQISNSNQVQPSNSSCHPLRHYTYASASCYGFISPFLFKANSEMSTLPSPLLLYFLEPHNQVCTFPTLMKFIYHLTTKVRDSSSNINLFYTELTGYHSQHVFLFSQTLHHHTHLISLSSQRRFLLPSTFSVN